MAVDLERFGGRLHIRGHAEQAPGTIGVESPRLRPKLRLTKDEAGVVHLRGRRPDISITLWVPADVGVTGRFRGSHLRIDGIRGNVEVNVARGTLLLANLSSPQVVARTTGNVVGERLGTPSVTVRTRGASILEFATAPRMVLVDSASENRVAVPAGRYNVIVPFEHHSRVFVDTGKSRRLMTLGSLAGEITVVPIGNDAEQWEAPTVPEKTLFAGSVPGGSAATFRVRLAERQAIFTELPVPSDEEKARISMAVGQYCAAELVRRAHVDHVSKRLGNWILVLAFIAALFVPPFLDEVSRSNFTFDTYIVTLGVSALCIPLAYVPTVARRTRVARPARWLLAFIVWQLLLLTGAFAALANLGWTGSYEPTELALRVVLLAAMPAAVYGLLLPTIVVGMTLVQRRSPHQATIVHEILTHLDNLVRFESYLPDWAVKAAVLNQLEDIALFLERALSHRLRMVDYLGQQWLQQATAESANGIRSFKRSLVSGDVGTVRDGMARCLVAVAAGDLSLLPREPLPDIELRGRIKRAGTVLRTLVVGLTPVAGLTLFTRHGPDLGEQTEGVMILSSVVWGLVVVLQGLDPLFNRRLEAVREFAAAVRLPGGKSG